MGSHAKEKIKNTEQLILEKRDEWKGRDGERGDLKILIGIFTKILKLLHS